METTILNEIILDLGVNYNSNDSEVLTTITNDVIENALYIANRHNKSNRDNQISILKLEIKKAVKSIYLQRGTEDVSQSNDGGVSNSYIDTMTELENNIVKNGKRLLNV